MKKLLSLVLVVALAFLFVGCGSSDAKPTKIEVSAAGNKTTLTVGEQVALSATVTPENATDKAVEWSSEDNAIATVSDNGTVTAVAKGEVDIVATAKADSSVKGTITIKVEEAAELTGIEITAQATKVEVGASITLTAAKVPANAAGVIAWSTSDAAIAKVENGKVTGVAVGKATITASVGEIKDEVEIEVVEGAPKATITITGANSVESGSSIQLTATLSNVEGEVEWLSSDESIATVDATGKVTGVAGGNVTITAKIGEVTGTFSLFVIDVSGELTYLQISGVSKVVIEKTIQLTADKKPAGSKVPLTWSSSDESIATVDENGLVTGIAEGVAIIYLEAAGTEFTDNHVINVIPAVATESITISGPDKVIVEKTAKLTVVATPENATQTEATWTSSDESIATVDENGTVTGVALGNVTITATLIDNPEISATYELVVSDPIKATGLEIVASFNPIQIGTPMTLKALFTPEDTTDQAVEWSLDDATVASVDKNTGVFTTLKTGVVNVTVQSVSQPEISATLTIEVIEKVVLKPESIVITGTNELVVGTSARLTATVYPDGVNQNVTWESKQNAGTVSPEGVITGVAAGQFRVRAVSAVDPKVTSDWFKVVVSEPVPEPPIPDMNGYVIRVMQADSALREIDPFHDGYTASDKAFKMAAWGEIESLFNCSVKVVPYPNDAPWGPTRVSWINSQAATGTPGSEIFIISTEWIPDLVTGKSIVDVTQFYKRYTNNMMEPAILEASSFKGSYYGIAQGLPDTTNYVVAGLFINLGLLKSKNIQDPAELFLEDKWTYTDFVNWATAAQAKLDEGQYVISGAPQLYWSGMVNAGGVRLADSINKKANVTNDVSLAAIQALMNLNAAGAIDPNPDHDEKVVTFQTGNAIMQSGQFWFIHNDTRFKKNMWGDETSFGYVPFPYPDGTSKDQTYVNLVDQSIYAIAAGMAYPDGVDAEGIYRVWSRIHLLAAEKQKSVHGYDAQATLQASIAKKLDSEAAISSVMFYTADKTLFDPIWMSDIATSWSSPIAQAVQNLVLNGGDPYSEIEAVREALEAKIIARFG